MNCLGFSFAGRGLEPGLQRLRTLRRFPLRGPSPLGSPSPQTSRCLSPPPPVPLTTTTTPPSGFKVSLPACTWMETEDGTGRVAVLHTWPLSQAYCVHVTEETLVLMSWLRLPESSLPPAAVHTRLQSCPTSLCSFCSGMCRVVTGHAPCVLSAMDTKGRAP